MGGELVLKMNEVIKTLASMRITFLVRKNGPKKFQCAKGIDFFGDIEVKDVFRFYEKLLG